jgi:hypothetical protein
VVTGAPQDVVDSLCDLDIKVAETLAGVWRTGVAANGRLTAVFNPFLLCTVTRESLCIPSEPRGEGVFLQCLGD